MKKWFLIPIVIFIHMSASAQVDSVSISVHTEDGSAFQKREKFKYLRRSMIDEPRLWKVTLQPYATTNEKSLTDQYLGNFIHYRNSYSYFHYGISSRIGYETKVGKVVSLMPELLTAYAFGNQSVNVALNLSVRYYVGQKRAMALGKTGNNLLASYLEARVNEIFGFNSLTYHNYYIGNNRRAVRINDFGFAPSLTLNYGVQKRLGKFGFFDVSAGARFDFGSINFHTRYLGEVVPAIKLSWGFATPPRKFRVQRN